jgi:putative transposase
MKPSPSPHYRHRFPAGIISHAVWFYHVFSLSLRDVELLLTERGVVVSYESVRRWCGKFAASFARSLRRRRPQPGDKWYLDEVFIRIQRELHYLWRAVDQDGVVLDILVQTRMRRQRTGSSNGCSRACNMCRVIVTDKLRSYGAEMDGWSGTRCRRDGDQSARTEGPLGSAARHHSGFPGLIGSL